LKSQEKKLDRNALQKIRIFAKVAHEQFVASLCEIVGYPFQRRIRGGKRSVKISTSICTV
jgi:hypothetical protein